MHSKGTSSQRMKILSLYQIGSPKKDEMMLWKAKHDDLKEELRNEALKNNLASQYIEILGENVAILNEDIKQWNYTVNELRQDYEVTIHSLMAETFENKWVKNIEKKLSLYGGNTFLCSLLVLLLPCLFLLTR